VEEDVGLSVGAAWIAGQDRSMWRTLRPSAGQAQQWVSEWVQLQDLKHYLIYIKINEKLKQKTKEQENSNKEARVRKCCSVSTASLQLEELVEQAHQESDRRQKWQRRMWRTDTSKIRWMWRRLIKQVTLNNQKNDSKEQMIHTNWNRRYPCSLWRIINM